jgi:hypothetical protein
MLFQNICNPGDEKPLSGTIKTLGRVPGTPATNSLPVLTAFPRGAMPATKLLPQSLYSDWQTVFI